MKAGSMTYVNASVATSAMRGDGQGVPIRCTQNPTMGEEWRRGWHPEKIAVKGSNASVLVVGAGPAGLEATRALGERGYRVMLAEAGRELGGRVTRESQLPGLSEWARVRDYRVQQIARMASVEVYRESLLGADDVLASEADHVVIATGATWRVDGFGRSHPGGIENLRPAERIFTPDDIMAGRRPEGRVLIFDDDNYYMGPVLAELLAGAGCRVSLVTPESKAGAWSSYTAEQIRTQRRLIEHDVEILPARTLMAFVDGEATLACNYTGREQRMTVDAVVMVTARQPNDVLYLELSDRLVAGTGGALLSVRRIGDCEAPAIIAAAVYAGHRYARDLDSPADAEPAMKHDRIDVGLVPAAQ